MSSSQHNYSISFWQAIQRGEQGEEFFAPGAEIYIWFGGSGKARVVRTVAEHCAAGRTSVEKFGPTQYFNRRQFVGDGFFAEAHTVTWPGGALQDRTCEALVVFELNSEGKIMRLDEFLDPAMCNQPRALPLPAKPQIVFGQNGISLAEAARNRGIIEQLFNNIAEYEDVSTAFAKGATVAQYFESTGGTANELKVGRSGKLRLAQFRGASLYRNRRRFVGKGFALELHAASLAQERDALTTRHVLDVGVLLLIDDDGKVGDASSVITDHYHWELV
jgi:hypothetical protein